MIMKDEMGKEITITPSELLKHSRQNRKNDVFYYQEYKENKINI